MKKNQILILIVCLIIGTQFVYAIDGSVEYDSVFVYYELLNSHDYQKAGTLYLKKVRNASKYEDKLKYYGKAAGAFETVSKITPDKPYPYTMLGHIYGKMNKYSLAKSYFNFSTNLEKYNPITNYYLGEFYFDNSQFIKALKYYTISYKNGYYDKYDLNLAMGIVYEKLGDLKSAKIHYKKAYKYFQDKNLAKKIRLLDDLKYDSSQYYYVKKKYDIN